MIRAARAGLRRAPVLLGSFIIGNIAGLYRGGCPRTAERPQTADWASPSLSHYLGRPEAPQVPPGPVRGIAKRNEIGLTRRWPGWQTL